MRWTSLFGVLPLTLVSGCVGWISDEPADGLRSDSAVQDAGGVTEPDSGFEAAESSALDAGADAGRTEASDGGPSRGQVPIVVAQGHVGRTTLSCDDGLTWKANRSFDLEGHQLVCGDTTPVVCGKTACKMRATDGSCGQQAVCDCVHGTGFSKGVVVAKNQVLATFGWGWPGAVLRSHDGATWSPTLDLPMALYPNIVFGDDRFVLYTGFKPVVSDDGRQWRYTTPPNPNEGGRASAFLDYGAGRFIAAADNDVIRVSSDRGETWHLAASVPKGCTDGIGVAQTIPTGNGVAVMVSADKRMACRSGDGGETWTLHSITSFTGGIFFQVPVFANGMFLAWVNDWSSQPSHGIRYSSTDGMTWTATPIPDAIWLGSTGVTAKGTLLSSWGKYGDQVISRSTDNGLTWARLPQTAFVASHALTRFGAGYVDANTVCP